MSSNFFTESTAKHKQTQHDVRTTASNYLKARFVRATAAMLPETIMLNINPAAEKALLTHEVYRRVSDIELFCTVRQLVTKAPSLLVGITRAKMIAILLSNGCPPIDLNYVVEQKRAGLIFTDSFEGNS